MKGIKLFCLPYAGGSAMVYKKWEKYLDKSIKLCLLELAGRGSRNKEPYYNSMQEAVEDIFSLLELNLDEGEYAIFGHSMGSILAYQLAAKIKERNLKQPIHIFFSGRYPPSIWKGERNTYLLPEPEFIQKATRWGGIPEKLFKYEVLLKAAMETLRADYKVLETGGYDPMIKKLKCDISILFGEKDLISTPLDMTAWKKYAGKQCSFHVFNGGHFYLHNNVENVVQVINNALIGEESHCCIHAGGF
ncbi:MAG: thioesterase II family protein [Ruminiclostridium sp.]